MTATVNINEVNPETRAKVLKQIEETEGGSATLARVEPLKISGLHQDRESRAQQLANIFIDEMIPLLVQVRQDFMDKDKDETICGAKTFTGYCTGILRYSESHVRNLIKGQNPASERHDGSAKRTPAPDAPLTFKELQDWLGTQSADVQNLVGVSTSEDEWFKGQVILTIGFVSPAVAQKVIQATIKAVNKPAVEPIAQQLIEEQKAADRGES